MIPPAVSYCQSSVRKGIPAKELRAHSLLEGIACSFVATNIRNEKWLLANIYHPPSQNGRYLFEEIGKSLDTCGNGCKTLFYWELST